MTDSGLGKQMPPQQSQSSPPEGRLASEAMLEDMRRMMADMKAMTMSGDPDHDFAMMMKRHHEGAITMAQRELQSGADAELKEMAGKMIQDQKTEAAELQEFLSGHQPVSKSPFAENVMKMMQSSPMMSMPIKSNPDQDFAALMAEHHKSAIDMSREYLRTGREPRIKEMASKMINKQQEEIGQLNDWVSRHASKGS